MKKDKDRKDLKFNKISRQNTLEHLIILRLTAMGIPYIKVISRGYPFFIYNFYLLAVLHIFVINKVIHNMFTILLIKKRLNH
jgi:hypothetical protein